ncbi:MAG: hypothetical protein ACFNVT_12050 [Corynebacterium matruchotii]|uniref:hypothetical protein n=1 Tax=Corynebacterium matruchotii TaxID=43768 RepID=UPI00360BAA5F
MSYDFLLYEPERTPDGGLVAPPRFFADHDFLADRWSSKETIFSLPLRAAQAELCSDDALTFEYLDVVIEGDRCLWVPVAYQWATEAWQRLERLAVRHHLGLADISSSFVVCYGDEDPAYAVRANRWENVAFSRASLLPSLEYLRDDGTERRFYILSEHDRDEHYIQTMMMADLPHEVPEFASTAQWWVEYRQGDGDHHYGAPAATMADAVRMFDQWLAKSEEFSSYPWTKMDF